MNTIDYQILGGMVIVTGILLVVFLAFMLWAGLTANHCKMKANEDLQDEAVDKLEHSNQIEELAARCEKEMLELRAQNKKEEEAWNKEQERLEWEAYQRKWIY